MSKNPDTLYNAVLALRSLGYHLKGWGGHGTTTIKGVAGWSLHEKKQGGLHWWVKPHTDGGFTIYLSSKHEGKLKDKIDVNGFKMGVYAPDTYSIGDVVYTTP